MYNMTTIAAGYKKMVKRDNPMSSQGENSSFFSFLFTVSICEDTYWLNLLQ